MLTTSEAARQLSRSRPLRSGTCDECGKPYQARDQRRRYCGKTCVVRAWRRKHREQQRTADQSSTI